ncbi:MAG: sugar phosphate isomerase/epimerase [Planctomycetota bacterium]|jgi:sugar phosphate isomerase/epimerase
MNRPLCLFTGQWADLPIETLAKMAKGFGYDGLELACWGDHFDVQRALREDDYCTKHWDMLQAAGVESYALSTHLVGQAVCDRIDERHQSILPEHVWGDGDPEGVRKRAAQEMKDTARAARRFFDAAPKAVQAKLAATGHTVVNGFTGSAIWHLMYAFPPPTPGQIEAGYKDFASRWKPIMDVFEQENIDFALEVHPTEIAFDSYSTRQALKAIDHHPRFGINFDPSHFGYQGADYIAFLREFGSRVFNVHVKDVWWSERPCDAGVFGGHAPFGTDGRFWEFASPGRGNIDFDEIIRQLNRMGYQGPLTVEWEDSGMHREHGAAEAVDFVRALDFPPSPQAFDSAFAED